ncbi:response regulator [uncultured Clostridium sp.]|uniref:response regulator n=1 Tax=uncultured Clostridium sp. TaxID=59620 RepID=UPI0028ED2BA3|nr:response regulator [uncultured Clostridium sp.]
MKKILVINDSKFESYILKDLLTQLGYEVKITNEYSAIYEINNYSPDVVIANLIMKEISGDLLIKKIKDMKKDTKCLLSSCNDLNIEDYRYNKVDGIIKTPVNLEGLSAMLKSFSTVNNKERFSFCPFCGGKIGEQLYAFCPYCGSRLKDENKYKIGL